MATAVNDELVKRGQELLENGDYLEARTLFTKLILSDPYDLKLWNYRASAHMKLGYPELSFSDAARCLELVDKKLSRANPSEDDYAYLLIMKIDALYSCFLAAEGLDSSNAMLHYIERLLKNAHLLQDDIHQKLLEKKNELNKKIKETTERFKNQNIPIDPERVSDIGRMHAVIYPWDEFESFERTDTETVLKELNSNLQRFAPKLSIVCMPDDPTQYDGTSPSIATSSIKKRPQLGVITRKIIKPKEVILNEPGIHVNNGLYGPKCNHCNIYLTKIDSRSTCKQCGQNFCSTECYQEALDSYHKVLCGKDLSKIMAYVARGISCSSLLHLVILRILAIAMQNNQHPLEVAGVKYLTIGNDKTVPWDIYRSYAFYLELLTTLELCPYRDSAKFDFWVYYTLSNKLVRNIFGEYAAPRKPADGKLYPFSSFFNHSCQSNALYVQETHARMSIVANEKIEKGQQVFINYCRTELSVHERQTLLKTSFGFVCKCHRCISELES